MHVGEKAYYERLHALVAGLAAAGATVLYEEGNRPAPGAGAATSDGERAVQYGPGDAVLVASRYWGWVRQPLQLGSTSSWRATDMTDPGPGPTAGPENVQEQRPKGAALTDDRSAWDAGLGVMMRLAMLDRFGLLTRVILRGKHRVVITERNRTALAALPPEGDAVLVWGAAHLPGLAAGLRKAGFRRRSAEWVTIGTVPALWPSIRGIWRALRS
jgi:hypothetical protein